MGTWRIVYIYKGNKENQLSISTFSKRSKKKERSKSTQTSYKQRNYPLRNK